MTSLRPALIAAALLISTSGCGDENASRSPVSGLGGSTTTTSTTTTTTTSAPVTTVPTTSSTSTSSTTTTSTLAPPTTIPPTTTTTVSSVSSSSSTSSSTSLSSTTTTTTTTTSTLAATASTYDLTIRLTDAIDNIGALQFEVSFLGSGGQFVGSAGDTDCTNLTPSFPAFNGKGSSVSAGFITLTGFSGPLDLGTCRFRSNAAPTLDQFMVTIQDAADLTTTIITPEPTIIVSSITEVPAS